MRARLSPEPFFKGSKSGETFNLSNPGGSRMGALTEEYLRYIRLYLRKKHQFSKDSENRRKQKVLTFLRFCEQLGVKRIKDIKEEHYRQFVAQVLNDKSTETKRKYLLALREFFQRAHLPIQVNPAKNARRTKEKKLQKVLNVLGIDIQSLNYEKIQELLKIL
jgi:site-specific recombinase XerD